MPRPSWTRFGEDLVTIIATSQRMGMSDHQKRRTDLRHLTGPSKWSPDHKRCSGGSFSWNDIRWLCRGSFNNNNTRDPPAKKKTILDFVQAFGEMTPEITGSHIYQFVLMATRATGVWKKALNICGSLVWNWLHVYLMVSSDPPKFLDNLCNCVL
jgi:hypothetical protein